MTVAADGDEGDVSDRADVTSTQPRVDIADGREASRSPEDVDTLPDDPETALADALSEAPIEFLTLLRSLNALNGTDPEKRRLARRNIPTLDHIYDGLQRARALGLTTSTDPDRLHLTATGKQICDGVKQYVNWLDHPSERPRGVSQEMVQNRDILDVGCGVGCPMLTFARAGARRTTGVDVMASSLRLCRVFARREGQPAPQLVCGTGANLPLADASFDLIFCRLALNYMPSAQALAEMARVARPGADLVVIVSVLPSELRALRNDLMSVRLRSVAFDLLKFINTATYVLFGRQIRLRFRGGMHSVHSPMVHTVRLVRRLLVRSGFRLESDDAAQERFAPAFHSIRDTP